MNALTSGVRGIHIMGSQRKSLLCRYRYDGLDRMISHARPDEPDLQRFYCQSKLATEIKGVVQRSIFQDGDKLLVQQKREGNSVETTLLAIDHQRSVLLTLDEKNHRQPIAYSPYGHRTTESGLTSLLGFNGEWPDPVTRHYLLGSYRAFNPVLMRFNSPDRLSPFEKGGLNCYAYCLGDPINLSDPEGGFPLEAIAMISAMRTYLNRMEFDNAPLNKRPLKKRAILKTHPHSKVTGRRNSLPPEKTKEVYEGQFEFVGYHGSSSGHAKELKVGVRRMETTQWEPGLYGYGFYTSPDYELALSYTPRRNPKVIAEVFGVWVKNYSGMVSGRDYLSLKNLPEGRTVIFNEHVYPSIRVDRIRGQFKSAMPRADEAPF